MKNEVAARAVAMAELARSGFRPRGDLWLLAVADEEDGTADVGMRWLLESRLDIRPDLAINEGGGERLPLPDGRTVQTVSVGEKGTYPVRVVAVGEPGHASTPSVGDNAVPLLGCRVAPRRTWWTARSSCCSASRSPTSSWPSPGRRPCTRSSPTHCRPWSVRRWRRRCSRGRPSAT